jgi:hypothetical protein
MIVGNLEAAGSRELTSYLCLEKTLNNLRSEQRLKESNRLAVGSVPDSQDGCRCV